MLVSYGRKSYWRGIVPAIASRNGTFVSFRFECEGLTKFVLVPYGDIEKCLQLKGHSDEIEIQIDIDQAGDLETMAAEFDERRKWFKKIFGFGG